MNPHKITKATVKVERNVPIGPKDHFHGKWYDLAYGMEFGDSVLLSYREAYAFKNSLMRKGFSATLRREKGGKGRVWKLEREKQNGSRQAIRTSR